MNAFVDYLRLKEFSNLRSIKIPQFSLSIMFPARLFRCLCENFFTCFTAKMTPGFTPPSTRERAGSVSILSLVYGMENLNKIASFFYCFSSSLICNYCVPI